MTDLMSSKLLTFSYFECDGSLRVYRAIKCHSALTLNKVVIKLDSRTSGQVLFLIGNNLHVYMVGGVRWLSN
jgi:hypothetical protein